MQYHCTDQFWFKWDPASSRLTRHTYDDKGTPCLPLSLPQGLRLESPPVFLGGACESVEDGCVTEDLQWLVDLQTMRACRLCRFKSSMGVKVVASCPRGLFFLALVRGKPESPLMHLSDTQLVWLPKDTRHATRAGACDVNFSKVALYMSHTQQMVVWTRSTNTIQSFPRCPAVTDFVACCHTHRVYAITYENPQRLITLDVDYVGGRGTSFALVVGLKLTFCASKMDIVESKVISETAGQYGKLFPRPCFATVPITPYVTDVS